MNRRVLRCITVVALGTALAMLSACSSESTASRPQVENTALPKGISASRVQYPSVESLGEASTAIVIGSVKKQTLTVETTELGDSLPYTLSTFDVDAVLSGSVNSRTLQIRQLGAPDTLGDVYVLKPDASYLLFLVPWDPGDGSDGAGMYVVPGAIAGIYEAQPGASEFRRVDEAARALPEVLTREAAAGIRTTPTGRPCVDAWCHISPLREEEEKTSASIEVNVSENPLSVRVRSTGLGDPTRWLAQPEGNKATAYGVVLSSSDRDPKSQLACVLDEAGSCEVTGLPALVGPYYRLTLFALEDSRTMPRDVADGANRAIATTTFLPLLETGRG